MSWNTLSATSRRTVATNCRCQGAPEKPYFGHIRGVRAARATLVCQAWSSIVLEVVVISCGCTC